VKGRDDLLELMGGKRGRKYTRGIFRPREIGIAAKVDTPMTRPARGKLSPARARGMVLIGD